MNEKKLEMTETEICRSFRLSANKTKQVKILAQLNLCSADQILEILYNGGELNTAAQKRSFKAWLTKTENKGGTESAFSEEELKAAKEVCEPPADLKKTEPKIDDRISDFLFEEDDAKIEEEIRSITESEDWKIYKAAEQIREKQYQHLLALRWQKSQGQKLKEHGFTLEKLKQIKENLD